jgi:putative spermidine/putrescine transport system permease protein
MTQLQSHIDTASTPSGGGIRYWRKVSPYLGVAPFLGLVALFLIWPSVSVVLGAFQGDKGSLSAKNFTAVFTNGIYRTPFIHSIQLSAYTAIIGAVLGGLFTWAIAVGKSDGWLRRITISASGVLAQFGGIMLTFAFLATFGLNGFITTLAQKYLKHSVFAQPSWLYGMIGLVVVYTFFQIPLMFIVFLPAIDNIRPNWREASDSLGGNTFEYWRRIGLPVLTPSFLGATLLLFANSFSAYATAASLISQGSIITPLQISSALSSETGGVNAPVAKALSLAMILVVVVVMALYSLLRRKVSKWEQ